MFNRKYMLSRANQAKAQHVPMTNYGVTIAYLSGILDKSVFKMHDTLTKGKPAFYHAGFPLYLILPAEYIPS